MYLYIVRFFQYGTNACGVYPALSSTPLTFSGATGVAVERFGPRDRWEEDHERAEAMRLWCEDYGVELLDLALQFCLREERIHGHPIGSLNIAQLERNVQAASTSIPDDVLTHFRSAAI